jgi:hypothetical protein
MEGINESLMAELEKIRADEAASKEAAEKEAAASNQDNQGADKTQGDEPAKTQSQAEPTGDQAEKVNENQSPAEDQKKSLKDLIAEEEEKEARVARLKEIEELEKDEFVKLVLDAKKNGHDIKKVISEVVNINPEEISEEELFYMTLDSDMSETDKQDEYENFLRLNSNFREKVLEVQREKIKNAQSEKLTALMAKGQNFDVKTAFNDATVGLDAALEKLQGKDYKGIELTPQRLLELRKEAMRFFGAFTNVDGKSIDYNEALETAFARKALSTWSEDIKKAGKNEGKIEAFKEIHNPNAMRSVASAQNKGQKDSQAELDAIYQKIVNAPTSIR